MQNRESQLATIAEQIESQSTPQDRSTIAPNTSQCSLVRKESGMLPQIQSDDYLRLMEAIEQKDQELAQKNEIIRRLQDRCMQIVGYQEQIEGLQGKVTKLEKIISIFENKENCSCKQNLIEGKKPENRYFKAKTTRTHNCNESFDTEINEDINCSHSRIKQKNNLMKINPDDLGVEKGCGFSKLNFNPFNEDYQTSYSEITKINRPTMKKNKGSYTSSFAQAFVREKKEKTQEQKQLEEIQKKFKSRKENHEPKKCENSSVTSELLSIFSKFTQKKQESAVKNINDKLKSILNKSVEIENSSKRNSREKESISMNNSYHSFANRKDFNDENKNKSFSEFSTKIKTSPNEYEIGKKIDSPSRFQMYDFNSKINPRRAINKFFANESYAEKYSFDSPLNQAMKIKISEYKSGKSSNLFDENLNPSRKTSLKNSGNWQTTKKVNKNFADFNTDRPLASIDNIDSMNNRISMNRFKKKYDD